MSDPETTRLCLRIMREAKAVYLSTIGLDAHPQIRAMVNLRNEDRYPGVAGLYDGHDEDFMVYFATSTSSEKMHEIRANPAVSAYFCEPDGFQGFTLCGYAEVVEDPQIREAIFHHEWRVYYPGGATDAEYLVLRLVPVRVKGWNQQAAFDFPLGCGL